MVSKTQIAIEYAYRHRAGPVLFFTRDEWKAFLPWGEDEVRLTVLLDDLDPMRDLPDPVRPEPSLADPGPTAVSLAHEFVHIKLGGLMQLRVPVMGRLPGWTVW